MRKLPNSDLLKAQAKEIERLKALCENPASRDQIVLDWLVLAAASDTEVGVGARLILARFVDAARFVDERMESNK